VNSFQPKSTAVRAINIARRVILSRFAPVLYSRGHRAYWEKLKDSYKGRRGFVIGNGPSLRMSDLDRLQREITIASNKIYLAFSETAWRPTYYTVGDLLAAKKVADQVHEYFDIVHVPIDIGVKFQDCRTYYWKSLMAPKRHPDSTVMFSDDATQGFYGGYSITYQNLQLAVHMGLNPIYLLGCDHNYKGEIDKRKVGSIRAGDVQNHFIKGYREVGEIVNTAPIDRLTLAYHHARAWGDANGVNILNATRGGELEVFERVEFDQVVG